MRIGAAIAVALAIAFIVWLIVRGGGGSNTNATTTTTTQTPVVPAIAPRLASVNELKGLAVKVGHPIYWVGPEPGLAYELTRTSSNRIFIRYLPQGTPAGAKNVYTFVGTYPVTGAYQALKALEKQGDTSFAVPGGGLAVYASSSPRNVYVAFPQSDIEIEVFDPSAKRARALVASGQVQPVR